MNGNLRWYPLRAQTHYGRPAVGSLIAHDFAVYRVLEVADRPIDLWEPGDREYVEAFKPAFRARHEPYMVVLAPVAGGKGRHYYAGGRRHTRWRVYPSEHYPVCAKCQEPAPCRDEVAGEAAKSASKMLERYLTTGVCPNCQEPITHRQKSVRYDENTRFPGGPPVTFHVGRRDCRHAAEKYAESLTQPAAAEIPLDGL